MRAVIDFPKLRVVSRTNRREHWAARHKRDSAHKLEVSLRCRSSWEFLRDNAGSISRLRVTFLRTGGNPMDSDNLQAAFKAMRDAVAGMVGVDDGDEAFWDWRYEQAGGAVGVRITLEVMG